MCYCFRLEKIKGRKDRGQEDFAGRLYVPAVYFEKQDFAAAKKDPAKEQNFGDWSKAEKKGLEQMESLSAGNFRPVPGRMPSD